MIITRSPLRISLGGGGTDLPSYYRAHGGFLVAAAIDKYVWVNVLRPFVRGISLKYSKIEHVEQIDRIEHPIVREAFAMMQITDLQHEITTVADIPAGTGLGSSGSFTTALLKAMHSFERRLLLPGELARMACELEIDRLGRSVGKQDQYIAAYGGITCFEFDRDGGVRAEPLALPQATLHELEDHLLLFFTGFSRSASDILADQDQRTKQADASILDHLHYVKDLGRRSRQALEAGAPAAFGELMHEHWEHKRKRSSGMSNPQIDEWYELGRAAGAIGGKLVGAGGGGFLMFYAPEPNRVRAAMARAALQEVRFRFDFEGTRVVFSMITTAAILAGGLATRLGAITERVPKALLDVAGQPFIAHQLTLLRAAGVTRVVLCVAHLAEQIEAAVGDGRAWGLDIAYARDGGALLGTGGALRQALPLLGERFFVVYGDSYLRGDYRAIADAFTASGKRGLMTVFRNDGRYDRSNVRFSDGRIAVYDKTPGVPDLTHIDWGLSAFTAAAFADLPLGKLDLASVFADLLARDQLVGYEVFDRFYEIGSAAGLAETRRLLSPAPERP